jgi:hypothetical protein
MQLHDMIPDSHIGILLILSQDSVLHLFRNIFKLFYVITESKMTKI